MKKLISFALALVFILSLSTVAFAEGTEGPTTTTVLKKEYQLSGGADDSVPNEKLTFAVAPEAANPDASMIYIGSKANEYTVTSRVSEIPILLEGFTQVGKWNYVVQENNGDTAGVTYDNGTQFGVQVLVSFHKKTDGTYDPDSFDRQVVFTTKKGDGTDAKIDTIYNKFGRGSLTVQNSVTGNLASQEQEFKIHLQFTSYKPVLTEITYMDGTEAKSVPINWTKSDAGIYYADVEISLKHDESVTFNNIPAGVCYTVTEDAAHGAEDTTGSNPAIGYTVTYDTNVSEGSGYTIGNGEIVAADKDHVTVINEKKAEVDTGVILDSAPYILLLAVAVIGLALFLTRKRAKREY